MFCLKCREIQPWTHSFFLPSNTFHAGKLLLMKLLHTWTRCHGRFPSCFSTTLRLRNASVPPAHVVENAPARFPAARHSARLFPRTYCDKKPASKLSPAPTASTTSTFSAALASRSLPCRAIAPFFPHFTTTSGTRSASQETACSRSSVPAIRQASRSLGKKTSTYFKVSSNPPCQVSSGSSLVSSDVVSPAVFMVLNNSGI